jgi:hypothetical protein
MSNFLDGPGVIKSDANIAWSWRIGFDISTVQYGTRWPSFTASRDIN